MARVKVSRHRQITVPAAICKQLGVQPGDHLLMEVRDGQLVLAPEPQDYSKRLKGLHREVWEGVDPQQYVQQERAAWTG